MTSLRVRVLCTVTLTALVLAGGERSLGWPSLPGVPSVPSAKQATKGVVSNELLKEFGNWFNLNRPVYVSGNDVLPTVRALPGGPFQPMSQAATRTLFSQARNGIVQLPPGDYNISVVTYCMGENAQGPWRNKFLLAPIKGAWADVVVALNFRASGSRFSPWQVQTLSWALQAGMNYAEMNPDMKQIVDTLLPDFKPRLQGGDFYDRAQGEWNSISSKVPGAPDFETALSQLGDAGKSIIQIRAARDEIVANANNFNALEGQFTHLGTGRVANVISATPWSIIGPGVYARLRTRGTLLTPGVVQIRVTAQAASSFEVASTHLTALGNDVASIFGDPFTGLAGFLNGLTQPLSWTPEPGNDPDPSQSGGGSDAGTPNGYRFFGSTWQRPGGGAGGNNGGNNQENNNDDSGGGGANGNESNGNGNDENNGNDFDTSTPCDPPGNVFGVQFGTVVSSSSNSLVLGRIKGKSKGIVCLLLRPFVSMAALGWPDRGSGSVDDGSVSYSLPGHSGPGQVVLYVHYTYATTSTLMNPYVKEQVTAVIDYTGVTPFCPELQQTLITNGYPQTGTWLSGAELENRLCIAGMLGSTIQVQTWVVDGDTVNSASLNHPVSPENFLYSDKWNHM